MLLRCGECKERGREGGSKGRMEGRNMLLRCVVSVGRGGREGEAISGSLYSHY